VVSPNGRYLQHTDGTPFFWLGDTAWELFHRLDLKEINTYLDNRKEKGFNVIQAVVLAENDGLRTPDRYGEVPLIDLDPTRPNEKYFHLIDTVIRLAASKGLYVGLLPTWGDKVFPLWGVGPQVFDEENANTYGKWIGSRYKDEPNIIWILGGDRPAAQDSLDFRPVWRSMAKGILEGTDNKALISYHPSGGKLSSSQFLQEEDWLDVNMIQSGHGSGHDYPTWELIKRDWQLKPVKPTLDGEPNYEDHPVSPWPKWDPANGYYDDYDVRKQCYRSVFAGACGVTYGHHSIWQFYSQRTNKINHAKMYWTEALDRPGAFQVGYLKKLMESRPMLERIPDQSIVVSGQGKMGEFVTSFKDRSGSYIMIYVPTKKTISINTSSLHSRKIKFWWFNPKTGQASDYKKSRRKEIMIFTAPDFLENQDWVLVIDNDDYSYPIPE